jgi:hypothetical protein
VQLTSTFELIDRRTLDANIQELICTPALHI